jgi:hypothetical protein
MDYNKIRHHTYCSYSLHLFGLELQPLLLPGLLDDLGLLAGALVVSRHRLLVHRLDGLGREGGLHGRIGARDHDWAGGLLLGLVLAKLLHLLGRHLLILVLLLLGRLVLHDPPAAHLGGGCVAGLQLGRFVGHDSADGIGAESKSTGCGQLRGFNEQR